MSLDARGVFTIKFCVMCNHDTLHKLEFCCECMRKQHNEDALDYLEHYRDSTGIVCTSELDDPDTEC